MRELAIISCAFKIEFYECILQILQLKRMHLSAVGEG